MIVQVYEGVTSELGSLLKNLRGEVNIVVLYK